MKTTFMTVANYVIADEMEHDEKGRAFNPKTNKWIANSSAVTALYRDFKALWKFLDIGNILKLSQQGRNTELSSLEESFVFIILKQFVTCKGPAFDIIKNKKKLSPMETEAFVYSIVRQMGEELNSLPIDSDGYYDKDFDELLKISERYWARQCRQVFSEIIENAETLSYPKRLSFFSDLYNYLDKRKKFVVSGGSIIYDF